MLNPGYVRSEVVIDIKMRENLKVDNLIVLPLEIPPLEPYEICKSVAKSVEREVCQEVKMKAFAE